MPPSRSEWTLWRSDEKRDGWARSSNGRKLVYVDGDVNSVARSWTLLFRSDDLLVVVSSGVVLIMKKKEQP